VAAAIAIGVARILVGVHYPVDVAASPSSRRSDVLRWSGSCCSSAGCPTPSSQPPAARCRGRAAPTR
jgi:hypothetical protein